MTNAAYTYALALEFDLNGTAGGYTRSFLIAVAGSQENTTTGSSNIVNLAGLTFAQLQNKDYAITPVSRGIAGTFDLSSLFSQSIAQTSMSAGDSLQQIRLKSVHSTGCGVVNMASLLIQAPYVTLKNGTGPVCLVSAP